MQIVDENALRDHRAVQAWRAFSGASVTPRGIEILKKEKKLAIYRLIGSNWDAQRARAVFRDIG
jgi:hypothetical protein